MVLKPKRILASLLFTVILGFWDALIIQGWLFGGLWGLLKLDLFSVFWFVLVPSTLLWGLLMTRFSLKDAVFVGIYSAILILGGWEDTFYFLVQLQLPAPAGWHTAFIPNPTMLLVYNVISLLTVVGIDFILNSAPSKAP